MKISKIYSIITVAVIVAFIGLSSALFDVSVTNTIVGEKTYKVSTLFLRSCYEHDTYCFNPENVQFHVMLVKKFNE